MIGVPILINLGTFIHIMSSCHSHIYLLRFEVKGLNNYADLEISISNGKNMRVSEWILRARPCTCLFMLANINSVNISKTTRHYHWMQHKNDESGCDHLCRVTSSFNYPITNIKSSLKTGTIPLTRTSKHEVSIPYIQHFL